MKGRNKFGRTFFLHKFFNLLIYSAPVDQFWRINILYVLCSCVCVCVCPSLKTINDTTVALHCSPSKQKAFQFKLSSFKAGVQQQNNCWDFCHISRWIAGTPIVQISAFFFVRRTFWRDIKAAVLLGCCHRVEQCVAFGPILHFDNSSSGFEYTRQCSSCLQAEKRFAFFKSS